MIQAAMTAPVRAALLLAAAAASLLGTTSCGASRTLHPRSEVIQADNERVLWNALQLAIVGRRPLRAMPQSRPSAAST